MTPEVVNGLFAIVGVLLGAILTDWVQRRRFSADLEIALNANRTEHVAEATARHFLSAKTYTDRSFSLLKKRLGGFDDEELRRILVRAGAVRYVGHNNVEYWRLISREAEAKQRALNERGPSENDDDEEY